MKIIGFGQTGDGKEAGLYSLDNGKGMSAAFTNIGASVVDLKVPDRRGETVDVVLGHDDALAYRNGRGSIGAVPGRFANRIAAGKFTINGKEYTLTTNNGPNTCHGGRDFYVHRFWEAKVPFSTYSSGNIVAAYAAESISDGRQPLQQNEDDSVTFFLDSPDGDQGFPGNLHVEVTYTLTGDNELRIDYSAECDADTPLNLTNHSYFNLSGHDSGTVLGHIARIKADSFLMPDENSLPTGEIVKVADTPMDFREPKTLGRDIGQEYLPLKYCNGYDHNFIIANSQGEIKEVAWLYSEDTGICMTVLTDMPGMQLYTGNGLNDNTGKNYAYYGPRSAVCMETQFWPDSVNREEFPGGILRAGEKFHSTTIYRFSIGPAAL